MLQKGGTDGDLLCGISYADVSETRNAISRPKAPKLADILARTLQFKMTAASEPQDYIVLGCSSLFH
jgi:hypothetical protein